jgi:hypothetical protein
VRLVRAPVTRLLDGRADEVERAAGEDHDELAI